MFLQQSNCVCFYPRSLAYLVSTSWPSEQCWGQSLSPRVGLKQNQILVGQFQYYTSASCRQDIFVDQRFLQLTWYLPFSFGSLQNTFQYRECQSIEVKVFTELFSCGLQQQSLTIRSVTPLDKTQSQNWKPGLVMRNFQLGLCLPIIQQFHLDDLQLCVPIFQEASAALDFHMTP